MKSLSRTRQRQNIGFVIGCVTSLGLVILFSLPGQEKLHVRGPMNTGHETLACNSCHKPAPGTMRQQIQANVKHFLDLRETSTDFGHRDVDNAVCQSCHSRPNDRHPVGRFFEPRFFEARKNIQPQFCTSCHLEHTGKRVTAELAFCKNCHVGLSVKNDPITIPHEALIATNRWETCLGCHDFHGNHVMEVNRVVEKAKIPVEILRYFDGAASPYSESKFYEARQEFSDE